MGTRDGKGGCPLLVTAFIVSFFVCSDMKMGVLEGGGMQGRVSEGSGEGVIEPLGGGRDGFTSRMQWIEAQARGWAPVPPQHHKGATQ